MQEYRILVAVVVIISGLIFAFLGIISSHVIVFVVGAVGMTCILLIIFYSLILGPKVERWLAWLIVSLSILVGLVFGYLLSIFEIFYSVFTSAAAGFLVGVLLEDAVLYLLQSKIVFWAVNLSLSLIGALMALAWYDVALILSTSLIGSFLTARGISLLVGGWTYEVFFV